jgi:hypothetical protein
MVAGAVQPPLLVPPPAPLPPPEVVPEEEAVTVVCVPVEEPLVTVVMCEPVLVACEPLVLPTVVVVPAPVALVGKHTPLTSIPEHALPPQAARAAIAGIATIAPKTHIYMT